MYVARIDGTVSFHDPESGIQEGTVLSRRNDSPVGCVTAAVAWSDDEQILAIASSDGHIRSHELATGKLVCDGSFGIHVNPTSLAISRDGKWIAGATNTSANIHVWNLQTGEPAGQLQGHLGIVRSLQFPPTADRLYSGSYDGTIREWSLSTWSQVRMVD